MDLRSPILLEPPTPLTERIMQRIRHEEQRRRHLRFALSMGAFLLSVGGMRVVMHWVAEDMARSGFHELLSLVFVDLSVLTQSGQEFGLALLETLPALSMSLGGVLFIAGCVSGWSAVKTGRLSIRLFSHK